jgi:hypothetical protein
MDVLFFWGSPGSYIFKTVIYKCEKLEVYKWAHCLGKVTSEQSNTFNSRFTGMHYVSKYNLTPGRGLKKRAACHKCVFQSPLYIVNTGTLTGLKYHADNSAS